MKSARTVSVEGDLREMPLLQPGTSARLGKILDALIDPARGEVIGVAVLTDAGKERVLFNGDYSLGVNTVMASEDALRDPERLIEILQGRAFARELVGAKVVTDDGKLLGHISSVQLSEGWAKVVYRVTPSGGQSSLKSSFLLTGKAAHSYSRSGSRIIVPAGTEEKYAIWSSGESYAGACRHRTRTALARDLLGRHAILISVVLTLALLGIILWF